MSVYTPSKWVIVKITNGDTPPIHKVFGSWDGGYLDGDSWRMNSGITDVTIEGSIYSFSGSSGSVYNCHKDSYGTTMYGAAVLSHLINKIESVGGNCCVLPEDTNWMEYKK